LPDIDDAGVDGDNVYIPLMLRGKVHSLAADGNTINVYLYNFSTAAYLTATTAILKPFILRKDSWHDQIITYTDDTPNQYCTVSGVNAAYQRKVIWEVDEVEIEETQQITGPYAVNEILDIRLTRDGLLVDATNHGRHWAEVDT